MASIVIGSIPAHGHVIPMLAIARGFVERGDHVRFVTGTRYADKVCATGASFIPLPPEADFDDRSVLEQFPERGNLKGAKAVAHDFEHVLARPSKAQYETVMAAHAQRPADAVLLEPGSTGGALLLGHPRPTRPPIVMCGVVPLPIASADTAPFGIGLLPARFGNRPRNAVLAALNRRILRRANTVGDGYYRQLHGKPLPAHYWSGAPRPTP